jgi:hypothetical protein
MSSSIHERQIEVGSHVCTAILSEGMGGADWKVHVQLPDRRMLPVPGTFDTEGQALIAASRRAADVLSNR